MKKDELNKEAIDKEKILKKIESLEKQYYESKENLDDDPKKFNFEEYKTKVVVDDIKKLEKFNSKYKGVWFIPLIGFFKYSYDYGQTVQSLDRGVVRQELKRAPFKGVINILMIVLPIAMIFAIAFLPIPSFYVTIIIFLGLVFYPLFQKRFNYTAIQNSKLRLKNRNI